VIARAGLMILCTTAVLTAAVSQETGRLAEPVGQPYTGDDATGPHVLGYWPFDGDQPLVDASGKGHDIVLQGAVVAPDGRFGGALVSGRGWPDADVPHQARIKNAPALTPAGAFTIEFGSPPTPRWKAIPRRSCWTRSTSPTTITR